MSLLKRLGASHEIRIFEGNEEGPLVIVRSWSTTDPPYMDRSIVAWTPEQLIIELCDEYGLPRPWPKEPDQEG